MEMTQKARTLFPDGESNCRAPRVLRAGRESCSVYRLKIAKAEENELERLPLEVALRLEKHLKQVTELAGETEASDAVWNRRRDPESGLLRFELEGFCVLYEVDRAAELVVVRSVKRVGPARSPAAPDSV